jgi:opacity protein-like surface antigen
MTIKRITLLGLAVIISALMPVAYAIGEGGYIGFLAGVSNTNNKMENVQLGTNPETSAPVSPSSTGLAGGFVVGYGFNPYSAFEFGYTHYATATYPKPEGSQLAHDATINTNAIDIAMKGSFPFKSVSIFGKVGLAYASASGSGSLAPIGSVRGPNNNALRPMYGMGVGYDVTQNWVVDFSYSAFTGGSGVEGANLMALGVTYHFVDLMCGQFLC